MAASPWLKVSPSSISRSPAGWAGSSGRRADCMFRVLKAWGSVSARAVSQAFSLATVPARRASRTGT